MFSIQVYEHGRWRNHSTKNSVGEAKAVAKTLEKEGLRVRVLRSQLSR